MSLNTKNSLRKTVINLINEEYPGLIGSDRTSWLDRTLIHLNERNNVWKVLVIVILCYYVFAYCWIFFDLPGIGFLKFDDIKSAATLIDQRTSNIATIISMTLAVTAILLSNMAIKDSIVYDLLYKRAKLRLIITYTLCVICSLIIIGTTKDSYSEENHFYFYRGVLTGTYMVIVILFMIGHLFKVVYEFSNNIQVKKMLTEGLLREAAISLEREVLQRFAKRKIGNLFKAKNFSPFTYQAAYAAGLPRNKVLDYQDIPKGEKKFIYDIDLEKFKKMTADTTLPSLRFHSTFTLDEVSDKYEHFLYLNLDPELEKKFNKEFTACLELRTANKLMPPDLKFQKYFAQKLQDSVEAKKYRDVADILKLYREVTKLDLKYKSHS